jgi:L-lactate dehydrogenase complex protein LldG
VTDHSRTLILTRLRAALRGTAPAHPPAPTLPTLPAGEERLDRLQRLLEAVRTEVHRVPRDGWVAALKTILRPRGLRQLLYAPETPLGQALAAGWEPEAGDLPRLVPFDRPMEECRSLVFEVDAALTAARGAVAETGSLVLWPDRREPRSMSLVPPLHIAVVEAGAVYDSLGAVMAAQDWGAGLPTNVVLVSGPSRTADIEMTLAFGVHGPKALVALILMD